MTGTNGLTISVRVFDGQKICGQKNIANNSQSYVFLDSSYVE